MPSSNSKIETRIRSGPHLWVTDKFHSHTSMDEIKTFLCSILGHDDLQDSLVQFYDTTTKMMITLDQSILDSRSNPFLWTWINSSLMNNGSVDDVVELYIIKNTNNDQTQHQLFEDLEQLFSEVETEQSSSTSTQAIDRVDRNLSSSPSTNERSINNLTQFSYGSQNSNFFRAILPNSDQGTNQMPQWDDLFSNSNLFLELDGVSFSHENFNATRTVSQEFESVYSALLDDNVPNPSCNSDSKNQSNVHSRRKVEICTPAVIQRTRRSPVRRLPTRSRSRSNHPINCRCLTFAFCRDVQNEKKNIYYSDQYNRKDHRKKNGYLACIQGVKTIDEMMSHVKPLIHLDQSIQKICKSTITVYAAQEIQAGDHRQWKIHLRKKFLPLGHTRETTPQNPIILNWLEQKFIDHHHMELNLRMITGWDKSIEENDSNPTFYELSEQQLLELHTAAHDASSPRLLCVIQTVGPIESDLICFSDFIRSK